jgi:hypothetical protein
VNGEDKSPTDYNTNSIVMYKSTRCKEGCKIGDDDEGRTGQLGKVILYLTSNINMIFLILPYRLLLLFVN